MIEKYMDVEIVESMFDFGELTRAALEFQLDLDVYEIDDEDEFAITPIMVFKEDDETMLLFTTSNDFENAYLVTDSNDEIKMLETEEFNQLECNILMDGNEITFVDENYYNEIMVENFDGINFGEKKYVLKYYDNHFKCELDD